MHLQNSSEEDNEAGITMASNLEVPLPTDLLQWERLRQLLEELRTSIAACPEEKRTLLLLCSLHSARQLVLNAHVQLPDLPFYVKRGWYLGLGRFLTDCLSAEEREHFFESTLPSIIQLVINLDFYRPEAPLTYFLRQREGQVSLARGFIASLIGTGFLCLFPEHSPVVRESMNDFNFCALFNEVSANHGFLAHKLRCFLNYFDKVMLMSAAQLSEPVTFRRCVTPAPQLLAPEDVLTSDLPLCPLRFELGAPLEAASRQLMHINFANAFIGGGILRRGAAQEEVKFAQCPELLACALFMQSMDDNEAILMANYRTFSRCAGLGAGFRFQGSLSRAQLWSETPLLCAIDALPFYSWYEEDQYLPSNLMREVNKAYTGFAQNKLQIGSAARRKPLQDKSDTSGSSEESDVEDFAGHLVHQAIDKALQDLSFRRSSSGSLPSDFLHSVRSIVGSAAAAAGSSSSSSSSGGGSTRSSFTSRSSRRGSSRRSSELSSCAGNDESGAAGGDLFRLEEELTEEEEDDDEEEEEVEEMRRREKAKEKEEEEEEAEEEAEEEMQAVQAPPILLQAPISDSSKLSLSHEYLTSQSAPSPASPAAFAASRFGGRRNSSPLRLGARLEQRRSSIPSHIRLLPLSDSAKMAANSCGLPAFSRAHNSSDSERLSVRSFRSWGSSCVNFNLSVDGEGLELWADAFAQHSMRDALADLGDRFCVAGAFAEDLSRRLLAEAVVEAAAAPQPASAEPSSAAIEDFAAATAAAILHEAVPESVAVRSTYEAYARRLSRQILGRAVRKAVRRARPRLSFSLCSTASSLSVEDLRDFESRLSLDAERPTPFVEFPPNPALSGAPSIEDFSDRLTARLMNTAFSDPRLSLTREDLPFFDALDVPYWLVENYADRLSRDTLLTAELAMHRKITGSDARGIATGNWGCGAFQGDPQLKCLIQWIAASLCRCPLLLYHCFRDPRTHELPQLIEEIRQRRLMVSELFSILHDFCTEEVTSPGSRPPLVDFVRDRL